MERNELRISIIKNLTNPSTLLKGVTLLRGKWGCGKTFLWQKEIQPAIEKEENCKDIPVIYVSCFGVDSLNQLKSTIITLLLKHKTAWKNNWSGKVKALGKTAANIAQNKTGYQLIDFKIDPLDLYDDEFIICIDDIERKSNKVSLKDLLGLIYLLFEKKKARVCIIANEEILLDKKQSVLSEAEIKDYENFVEKIVSYRFYLNTEIVELYDIFIEKIDKNNHQFLVMNKELITSQFSRAKVDNLRTLVQIIQNICFIRAQEIELSTNFLKILIFYTVASAEGILSKGSDYFNFHSAALGSLKSKKDNRII